MVTKIPKPNVEVPPTTRPCDRLWYLVTRDGVSNAALARQLDVTKKTARRYVVGMSDMPSWVIISICKMFKCSADFLLGLKREVNG